MTVSFFNKLSSKTPFKQIMGLAVKFPFFDMTPKKSPLSGLLGHFDLVEEGIALMSGAVEAYKDKKYDEFAEISVQLDMIEEKADATKRYIRNHMPSSLFMPVDRTIFFTLTRSQDNILDRAQEALGWLDLRTVKISKVIQEDLALYMREVFVSVQTLRPVLEGTVELVGGGTVDREDVKAGCRAVLHNHEKVKVIKRDIIAKLYASSESFKDVYQILKFVEEIAEVSHNTERCADMLRAMIAK